MTLYSFPMLWWLLFFTGTCPIMMGGWMMKMPFFVQAIPTKVTIKRGYPECLFHTLHADEKVTASVFILSGSTLKATMTLEGPILTDVAATTKQVWDASRSLSKQRKPTLSYSQILDWEHLYDFIEDIESSSSSSSLSEDEVDKDDPQFKEKKRARRRQKQQERKEKMEAFKKKQQDVARTEGEPIQYTTKVPETGWYQMCIAPHEHQIVVEMEMRKESELGAVDEDGHVVSYETQEMNEEDEDLDKDTASEEGIRDEDFDETKEKMKELRRLIGSIQTMQQRDRRRISINEATSEHLHSRMVMNSLIETIFFMLITGYQIYTIRKWFSGGPTLGR